MSKTRFINDLVLIQKGEYPMKTNRNQLLTLIARLISLITRPIYMVMLIALVALFPSKKIRQTPIVNDSNTTESQRIFVLSSGQMLRKIKWSYKDPANFNWLNRTDYEDYLAEIDIFERAVVNDLYVDYSDLCYEYDPENLWSSEELWEILKDKYHSLVIKYEQDKESLTQSLKDLKAQALKFSYCSFYYWPYNDGYKEFCIKDEHIEEIKLSFKQALSSNRALIF